ncbi:MAG: hypothetical protein AAFR81_04895 [Chloroflexota bacterium]
MATRKRSEVANYHVQYSDLTSQHWDRSSESYAGGDHLITALENAWDIEQCELKRHWYAGMRSVRLYHFTLTKNGKTRTMPVLDNPYIERFIKDEGIDLIEGEEAKIR